MIAAIVYICVIGSTPECDENSAFYRVWPPDRYKTVEECHERAVAYLHSINFDDVLEEGKSYAITVSCRDVGV